jgi:hypothetical protein
MPILSNDNLNQVFDWLEENLLLENSFVPHVDAIPNVKSKGIYFWFMRPDGYKALSNYVTIKAIEPKYTRDIKGVNYDLAYIGTSGTGKQGKSSIYDRLKWHINQTHGIGEIGHGTLSTFRAGLGALLADDLIIPNTEKDVNAFMKEYMIVFWIEYPDNKSLIDIDEDKLINSIKPLINLKSNPNAKSNSAVNSTKLYKSRRKLVYDNSKLRLGI